jgi:hypothetical protein
MSISHPATPNPISIPSHTTNKMIPYGLSGSAVFYVVKSTVSE